LTKNGFRSIIKMMEEGEIFFYLKNLSIL